MQPQDIHLTDWLRILIGEVPVSFFVELLIRSSAIFFILLISMRVMGKRMSSQLSRNEMAALVSLAAAIGVPLMAPDRGILPAIVIALVLISVQIIIAKLGTKNEKFESYSQGQLSTLVSDGVIDMKELNQASLAHERILAQLRSAGLMQLGQVSRLYMEASGAFTLIKSPDPQPGLSILPIWDHELRSCLKEYPDQQLCARCGFPQRKPGKPNGPCPNCRDERWVTAVKETPC
jgi:uncharacterized membrane protein YcaP (DUF421 family)